MEGAGFGRFASSGVATPVATSPLTTTGTPVEEGAGSLPQAYRGLPEASRRDVREEVKARLSPFESNGRLVMSVEMLIVSGRA
jgi:hypothetical protein